MPFEMLELYEGKLSRTVLRGEWDREVPDLPGDLRAKGSALPKIDAIERQK